MELALKVANSGQGSNGQLASFRIPQKGPSSTRQLESISPVHCKRSYPLFRRVRAQASKGIALDTRGLEWREAGMRVLIHGPQFLWISHGGPFVGR